MPYKDREAYNAYQREYRKKQYNEYVQKVRAHKVLTGCVDCGYNQHHAGLELDHRDGRTETEASVSQLFGRGWNRIQEELDKCDVVCGTCHNIRTWDRRQAE